VRSTRCKQISFTQAEGDFCVWKNVIGVEIPNIKKRDRRFTFSDRLCPDISALNYPAIREFKYKLLLSIQRGFLLPAVSVRAIPSPIPKFLTSSAGRLKGRRIDLTGIPLRQITSQIVCLQASNFTSTLYLIQLAIEPINCYNVKKY
jgi:hypothetical protein